MRFRIEDRRAIDGKLAVLPINSDRELYALDVGCISAEVLDAMAAILRKKITRRVYVFRGVGSGVIEPMEPEIPEQVIESASEPEEQKPIESETVETEETIVSSPVKVIKSASRRGRPKKTQ